LLFLLLLIALVEVDGGELKTVEEQTGTARVDVVDGERCDDVSDGFLDGVAGGGFGQLDGAAAGLSGCTREELVLVEVAEVLVAKSVAAAAASVGVMVVAAEVVGRLVVRFGGLFRHGCSPWY